MADKPKQNRPKARVAKGFRDIEADEIRGVRAMVATIQQVYESYGFEPVEQPFVEYTDALGKFLPDQDRPNAGVFSFQDDESDLSSNRPEQWLSLRYDLTAPLARYVAENFQKLPTPFRSYRQGWVFRNEKPGPGRFRQFMQFDADTVGSASPAADAEVCMMAADTMEALGIARGQYRINVNSRKVLEGLIEAIGVKGDAAPATRMSIYRALDKLDRLGVDGVMLLLGKGRKDESGDFTIGAGLHDDQINHLINATGWLTPTSGAKGAAERVMIWNLEDRMKGSPIGLEGLQELQAMTLLFESAGYGPDRIKIDPAIVRGLEYYTGPVFECELLMDTKDQKGNPVRFGSVGGGGRYDDLVSRFTGQQVPATGFSIGVSRLYAALKLLGKTAQSKTLAPVLVTVMDKDRQGDYWNMVQRLRAASIRAEMSLGAANMGKQMKYADRRGCPLVIIQGGDERSRGEVQIKDLRLGSELASNITSREDYTSQRLAQFSVPESDLVEAVKKALGL